MLAEPTAVQQLLEIELRHRSDRPVKKTGPPFGRAGIGFFACRLLKRALGRIGVGVALDDGTGDLVDEAAVFFGDFAGIPILDRVVVVVELERPADRLKIRRLKSKSQSGRSYSTRV